LNTKQIPTLPENLKDRLKKKNNGRKFTIAEENAIFSTMMRYHYRKYNETEINRPRGLSFKQGPGNQDQIFGQKGLINLDLMMAKFNSRELIPHTQKK
jgi:hypothetical protein